MPLCEDLYRVDVILQDLVYGIPGFTFLAYNGTVLDGLIRCSTGR